MNNLKEELKNFFERNLGYYTQDELRKRFKIKGQEQTDCFLTALNELVIEGSLFFNKDKYCKMPIEFTTGKININKNGIGFINTQFGRIVIRKENLNNALNNDIVLVDNDRVKKVLKRDTGKIAFLCSGNGTNAILTPFSVNYDVKLKIKSGDYKKLFDGDIVIFDITKEEAEIVKVINKNDPDAILKSIAFKYDIDIDFKDEVLDEVYKLKTSVTEEDCIGRCDLREKEIFTIDCDNTKDMDDAVGVEVLENGNLKLYISIAHVSHYVEDNSKILKDAINRSTSVYMDDTCIPMLHRILSNDICSLNPNVDRLARTSIIEFDKNGNIISFEKVDSVIRSKKKMKYSEVNKILENNELLEDYKPYIKSLFILNSISEKLEKERKNRQAINFASNEVEFVKENKEIKEIKERKQGKAERLIENLMILNNQLSAERYSYFPYIYRIHEKPDEEVFEQILEVLSAAKIELDNKKYPTNVLINKLLEKYKDKKEYKIISQLLLESMKKAKYSNQCLGHFALSLYYYTHTTSPIRRIVDLIIQIYEDKYDKLEKENKMLSEKEIKEIEELFNQIAIRANTKEKNAKKAEREADTIRIAEYAKKLVGQEFTAVICKIKKDYIIASIDDKIKGIIYTNQIDEGLKYNNELKQLVGKKRVFKIGDSIDVLISDSNVLSGEIKFSYLKQKIKTLQK